MDLRYLADFLDLARTGNFSATARNRSISQPALSRRIQQLERWAGAPLVDRSMSPLRLTPAGRRLRPLAERALRALDGFRAGATRRAGAAPVRVMALHSIAVARFLGRRAAGRGSRGEISFGSYDQCFDALRSGAIDAALLYLNSRTRDARQRGLARQVVGSERFVPAIAAGFAPREIVELSRDNYLGRALAPAIDRARRALGVSRRRTAPRFDAVRGLVEAGSGVGWLPASLVAAVAGLEVLGVTELEVPFDVILVAATREALGEVARQLGLAVAPVGLPRG